MDIEEKLANDTIDSYKKSIISLHGYHMAPAEKQNQIWELEHHIGSQERQLAKIADEKAKAKQELDQLLIAEYNK